MCRQFHCLPSQLYAEDAELFQLIEIERLGTPEQPEPEGDE